VSAKVRFLAHGRAYEGEVPLGTTVLEASKLVHAPEGDACGGVCACSTCHVYVQKGRELLSEAEEDEEDILDKAFDVRAGSRLGCQSKIVRDGELECEITRESLDAFYNEHPNEKDPRKH
jgi:ferredoxin